MTIGRNYVLVDIDHVLSDAAWRDAMIGGEGGWDAYHTASVDDKSCTDVVELLKAFQSVGLLIVGITARPEKWRTMTNAWLLQHDIEFSDLLMRPDDSYRPAPEIKIALAEEFFNGNLSQILFIIDDRDDVVAAFKARGVTALQCHGRQY